MFNNAVDIVFPKADRRSDNIFQRMFSKKRSSFSGLWIILVEQASSGTNENKTSFE